MSYLSRQMVMDRLRVGMRASYRLVGSSYTSLVDGDEVLEIVNRARRGIREPLAVVPSDLATPEEVAETIGCVTAARVLSWCRRTKNVPPHFRFNKHTTRFPMGRMMDWVRSNSRRRTD